MFKLFILLFLSVLVHAEVRSELLIAGVPPVQLPPSAQFMVDWETRFNPAGIRSNQPFWIEHLEIPLSLLSESLGLGLDKKIYDSMVFKKNGVPYVRWILNPEDTIYGEQVKAKLVAEGYDASTHRHYIGYLTSSRSCIVQDPSSGVTFSIKGSTNTTGGNWQDKKETGIAAKAGRMMSDLLTETITDRETRALRVLKEPLSFTFAGVDQAIIVRQYEHFNNPLQSRFLIPVFSLTHELTGADIAIKNGNFFPAEFWGRHMMGPLGTALAELTMLTGIVYNSPHGQNFMVELDSSFRPTGLIYVKDYADSNIQASIMKAIGGEAIVRMYSKFTKNISFVDGEVYAAINPIYSGHELPPSWLSETQKEYWKNIFIEEFSRRASSIYSNSVGRRLNFNPVPGWNSNYWVWVTSLPAQERYDFLEYLKMRPKNQIQNQVISATATVLPLPAIGNPENAQISSWEDFLTAINHVQKLGLLKGRLEELKNSSSEISLTEKKQLPLKFRNSRLRELLSVEVESDVLLDVAYAMSKIDPALITAFFYNLRAKIRSSNPSSAQIEQMETLLKTAQKYEDVEIQLRTADDSTIIDFVAKGEFVELHGFVQIIEALMYRIKVTQSSKLKAELVNVLLSVKLRDPIVKDFLIQNSSGYRCLNFYR